MTFEEWWKDYETTYNYSNISREEIITAQNAARSVWEDIYDPHIVKIKKWFQWCLNNCDDSPEHNFGTLATKYIRLLLEGKDAPGPEPWGT